MTKAELMNRMGSDEFTEWLIYNQIEPIGEEREDYRHALMAYYTQQVWSKRKLSVTEFLPPFGVEKDPRAPKMTGDQMKATLRGFHEMDKVQRSTGKQKSGNPKDVTAEMMQSLKRLRDQHRGKHSQP